MSLLDSLGVGSSTPQNYVAGQIIIQFDSSLDSLGINKIFGNLGLQLAETLRQAGGGNGALTLANLPAGVDVQTIADALSHVPGVKFAEPNYILTTNDVATDPAYTGNQLWGMEGDATNPANQYGSQAGEAWAAGYTGSTKVAVGVVDTGIDYTHADLYKNVWLNPGEIPAAIKANLKDTDGDGVITFRDLNNSANAANVSDLNNNGRIDAGDLLKDSRWADGVDTDGNGFKDDLVGWDFVNNDNDPYDDNSHGTHVSGTIAASANDGGVVGINWSAELVALKFLNAQGSGTTADAIKALDYLTNAAKAANGYDYAASNNSWGGDAFSQSMLDAIVRGAQQQILFVAAAGNGNAFGQGLNNDNTAFYPSSYSTLGQGGLNYDAVISVAAITSSGAKASFSNYGANSVDIGAPGNSIYSTVPGGYGTKSGTSMAAPHVTGAVALYSSAVGPDVTAAAIKAAILNSAAPTPSLLDLVVSDGRLDIGKLMGSLDTTPPTTTGTVVDAYDDYGPQVGAVAANATTDDTSPQIRGTLSTNLVSGESVLVYRDNALLGTASVNGTNWTYQDGGVANGAHTWMVRVSDQAGNQGTASNNFSLNIQGPSLIYGTSGNDTITGTSGDDKIWGVSSNASDLGRGRIDVITGGLGADTFVLGDARGRFYDDTATFSAGTNDYARIMDFNSAEGDKIQVRGVASNYLQHTLTLNNVQGLGIYFDTNNSHAWDSRDELIAFLPNKSSVAAGDFIYV